MWAAEVTILPSTFVVSVGKGLRESLGMCIVSVLMLALMQVIEKEDTQKHGGAKTGLDKINLLDKEIIILAKFVGKERNELMFIILSGLNISTRTLNLQIL